MIDRSPCGTGTSARLAQRAAKGLLAEGDSFVHESFIGSTFTGTIEGRESVGNFPAIIPGVRGAAHITGLNTIFVDSNDPFPEGFSL
jgi:4-hydroxyproline epimerase